ncbi:MAG: 4Fe-4S dicluster domain-containing protein [Hyphomicrobiaceae bacterium]|nr:4Fe-4S dicluster domain-containing protein [Hyphomicrobiaceae bacterium]
MTIDGRNDKPARPAAEKRLTKGGEERRQILRSVVAGSAITCLALAGLLPQMAARANPRLRPPGAIFEEDFLAACIKCGQCVQVCPVEAIKLADATDGVGIGTPFINARDQACDFSCDATQCVLACPTEALTHKLTRKEEVTMGKARLAAPDKCLARAGKGFKGKARGADHGAMLRYEDIDRWTPLPIAEHDYDLSLCDLCVRECPIPGAIALEPLSAEAGDTRRTPVVKAGCVGCGVCEMMCPTDQPAIVIDVETGPRGVRRV